METIRGSRSVNRSTPEVTQRTVPSRKKAARKAEERSEEPRAEEDRTAESGRPHQGVKPSDAGLDLSDEVDRGRTEDPHSITRRTRGERNIDRFAVPQTWRKSGWDYQYWVTSVMGEPVEGTTEIYEGGWRPVFWKDVPKPWSPGAKTEEQIIRGGQALYTRPMHLTNQAKREDYEAAEQQRQDRMRSATQGHIAGGEGLANIKGIRTVPLALEVEGEVGVQTKRTPTE